MSVCRTDIPPLDPGDPVSPEHLKACHLDQETRQRESAKLLANITSGGVV
jgi:hypothetical protein